MLEQHNAKWIFNNELMLYSCLLWHCKCVIGTPQQKHLEIAYAPLVARELILQQHVYKFCIGIDLVNDNQYWIVLINSATGKCSIDLIHRAHLYIWSNKFIMGRGERVHRGKGWTSIFILLFFYCGGGGGWRVMFYLTCGRRKGKGWFFLWFFFFIVEWQGTRGNLKGFFF